MNCIQCNKPAILTIAGGWPLCVEHYALFQQANAQQFTQLAAFINMIQDDIDETIGIPSSSRIRLPQPVINRGNTTVNNLNIDRSTIGVLNTGVIDNLNATISLVKQAGQNELAETIKDFAEQVSKNTEITKEAKKDILEQLSFLATQIRTPTIQRNPSVIKSVFSGINTTINTSAGLITIWDKLKPLLEKFL